MKENKKGQVTLVGAGPGDRGLLTLKGKEAIEQAEVVIYDRLVSPEVMSLVPESAEKINVGKKKSHHPVPQEEINEIILNKALEGKNVVRIKGGDSFLFGRGAEELFLLTEHQIPYEVVPGITSAIAVPTYAGIPVTHRDMTSSVHIITGHAKAGSKVDINYKALIDHKGTLVFLMGLAALGELMDGLLEAGMDPLMPAVTIEKGTTSFQRKIIGTVGDIAKKVKENHIESPAITIVGQVASLTQEIDWFTSKPLIGKKILVTRPKEKAGQLADRLRSEGAKVIEFPCIETIINPENEDFNQAMGELKNYSYMVFTSPNGVEKFFTKLRENNLDIRILSGLKLAAVGQQTKKLLEERGLIVDYMPKVYDSIHLADGLVKEFVGEKKIMLIRGKMATSILPDALEKAGIGYRNVLVYDTLYKNPMEDFLEDDMHDIDYAVFSSASTVEGFTKALPMDFSKVHAICIGDMTAEAARAHGMKVDVSNMATIDSLVEKVIEIGK